MVVVLNKIPIKTEGTSNYNCVRPSATEHYRKERRMLNCTKKIANTSTLVSD